MSKQVFVVVPDAIFEDGHRETLPPCGVLSTIELAREFVKDHFQHSKVEEPWDEEAQAESYTEQPKEGMGCHAEIIIWGRELDA